MKIRESRITQLVSGRAVKLNQASYKVNLSLESYATAWQLGWHHRRTIIEVIYSRCSINRSPINSPERQFGYNKAEKRKKKATTFVLEVYIHYFSLILKLIT